uniref:Uncharacterized protein n=1 Tax=Rhizophora mucronata TaxID=61149 RepID=A0A2P2R4M3_RHIMU
MKFLTASIIKKLALQRMFGYQRIGAMTSGWDF